MVKKKTSPATTPISKDGPLDSTLEEENKTETKQSPPTPTPDTIPAALDTQSADSELADSGSVPQVEPVLGVFQDMFDAWIPVTDFVDGIPDVYFRNILTIQMNEIDDHVCDMAPMEKVINEMVDIISVTFNWMRSKGLDDQGIADAVVRRTSRFADVQAIMDSYNERYGL